MSNSQTNKLRLRKILIYSFNLKKSAAEAHRLLIATYGDATLSEISCRKWFLKFKNCEFVIEDKERSGSIVGSRFEPNARTIRWIILQIKLKVAFFHNK